MWIAVASGSEERRHSFADHAPVTVGGDPGCALVLAGLPPVAAVIFRWGTRIVCRPCEGPLPVPTPHTPRAGDEYIDRGQAIALGPYRVSSPREELRLPPVSVRVTRDGASHDVVVGDGTAVWEAGLSIGSDGRCLLVLPDLPALAAVVIALSNHKMLWRAPEGAVPPAEPRRLSGTTRVDTQPFQVGPYTVQLLG